MTCSIGVALFPDHGADRDTVVAAADAAMYAAKHRGRNQVCIVSDVVLHDSAPEHVSREDLELQGTIDAMSALLQARDGYTGAHTATVSKLAWQIGITLGMSAAEARMVGIAGQLHDIGKIGIPDAILRKPGPLTEAEWELMRVHPTLGAQIINHIPALQACRGAIEAHHERWDGTGYPQRLAGAAIPLGARIIAVVDAYDAIVTDRPYHQAQPASWALHEIQRCAGSQFDPQVVHALGQLCAREQEQDAQHAV